MKGRALSGQGIITINELPPPPGGCTGWPWTEARAALPESMPEGRPWPRISMVTPSYNQGQFIEETIRSVLLQGYPNLEYIIIDGGSTDRSVEIIRKYSPWLTYWVSEPDRGQSHAINKGLAHCCGDLFNWINSDDLLCPGALGIVAAAWRTPNSIVTGPVVNFTPEGQEEVMAPNGLTLKNFVNPAEARRCHWVWHQPGTYLPLAEVRAAGGVREDLRFTMDHLLMVELLPRCPVVYVDEQLACFRLQDNSKSMSIGFPQFELERVAALRACGGFENLATSRELKEEHVRCLLTVGALARRKGQYRPAVRQILHAVTISPHLVLRELLRRGSLGRFARWLAGPLLRRAKRRCG